MPFDQIHWNNFGGGNFANSREFESSNIHDVRFGQTATEDSHSAFSFSGRRRERLADWLQVYFRDPRHPNNYIMIDSAFGSGTSYTVKYWTSTASRLVYGWPGIDSRDGYSSNTVNSMDTSDLSADNGYSNQRDQSGTDSHSTLTDDLFQAQNRESCHTLSNVATGESIANPFIGIHKDNPLKITTTKSYKGYYLVLKRKRNYYWEYNVKLTTDGMNFTDIYGEPGPTGGEPLSEVYHVENPVGTYSYSVSLLAANQEFDDSYNVVTLTGNDVTNRLMGLFRQNIPKKNTVTATDLRASNINANGDEANSPIYYGNTKIGYAANASIAVRDAVLHPEYNIRTPCHTGSVNIKNITIKVNGTVLKAEDDVHGKYASVQNTEIATDRSSTIKATSGGSGNRTITFSNLYGGKTTIIKRYISTDFKIKFAGDSTEYGISSVSSNGNTITLSSNLAAAKSNSNFTLLIPRGSPNSNYTWGNYKLTNFDGESYDNTICDRIKNDNDVTTRDLYVGTPVVNNTNNNRATFRRIFDQVLEGTTGGTTNTPDRHPYFSNELTEALAYPNDWCHSAYWERFWWESCAGQISHISAKLESPTASVSWNKCKWVEYFELELTEGDNGTTSAYNASGFSNLKDSSLLLTKWADEDLDGDDVAFTVKQFFYGGVDKATGAIWPNYKVNLASKAPSAFAQTFTQNYSNWGTEFTEAYGGGSNVGEHLDQCWFVGCAIGKDTTYRCWPHWSDNYFMGFSAWNSEEWAGLSQTDTFTNNNNNWTREWNKVLDYVSRVRSGHPWSYANYGFGGDMLGWQEYLAGKSGQNWAYHGMTIYESDGIISSGSTIEVSLHQFASLFNQEFEDDVSSVFEEVHFLGRGQSTLNMDNYQLFIIAK